MSAIDPGSSALLTDYYQLTMLKSYFESGMTEPAAFEFFVRKLPATRNFLLAAGLEPALEYLENLRFTAAELEWLAAQPGFPSPFIERLAELRFTGDVDAMPEGTLVFCDEPLLRVVAPLPVAQLVETRLVSLLHFSTLVASKAARSVLAAPGKLLVDFGLWRAHGSEAGLLAARAAYLAGFDGTATVLAGKRYGIPLYGTMAHSFIQAHERESEAFLAFARGHPRNTTLLIDTYDTERGAARVAELMPLMLSEGIRFNAVRIDSGDLGDHASRVRRVLDENGCREVRIFASGGLDEHELARLASFPIDGFGVGTSLVTSSDVPGLDCAYKLQEYAGRARRKRSEGKATWPGRKQVLRFIGADGCLEHDVIALDSDPPSGRALLEPAMRSGKRVQAAPSLEESRARARRELQALPGRLGSLERAQPPYRVEVADSVKALAAQVDELERRSAH